MANNSLVENIETPFPEARERRIYKNGFTIIINRNGFGSAVIDGLFPPTVTVNERQNTVRSANRSGRKKIVCGQKRNH